MPDHLEPDLGAATFLLVEGCQLLGVVLAGGRRLAFKFANADGACTAALLRYFQGAAAPARSRNAMHDDLLTVPEAVTLLRLKTSTIRAWTSQRRIAFVKVGGRVIIRRPDLQAYVESRIVPVDERRRAGAKAVGVDQP